VKVVEKTSLRNEHETSPGSPPYLRPGARYQELGPDYYSPRSPTRQTRDKIRDIERLNPGKKVILADAGPEAARARQPSATIPRHLELSEVSRHIP
jgi:hypothetical protein